jgi:hypothetical protein
MGNYRKSQKYQTVIYWKRFYVWSCWVNWLSASMLLMVVSSEFENQNVLCFWFVKISSVLEDVCLQLFTLCVTDL